MDMNKFAESVFHNAFQDEMRKMAKADDDYVKQYGPLVAALALAPAAMNAGARSGNEVARAAAPIADVLLSKRNRDLMGYIKDTIGGRQVLTHAGNIGGAATGLAGLGAAAYLLHNYLNKE